MYYYGSNDYRDYLAHHGVLGMEWGKRNGPPYPLSLGAHSASEKKAGWKKSLKSSKTTYSGATSNQKIKKSAFSKKEITVEEARKSNKNTAWKTAATVAIGVLTLNPYMVGSALLRAGEAAVASHKEKSNNERLEANTNIDKKTGLRLKNSEFTPEQDLKMVNPGVRDFNSDSKNNCMLCTTAYELRRRGYDVVANKASFGYMKEDVENWFSKAKTEQIYPPAGSKIANTEYAKASMGINHALSKEVTNALKKQGNGARGNLMVQLTYGGHSVFYEVVDDKVIIRDAQVNKTYKNPDSFLKNCASAEAVRLDNLSFDSEKIKEAVR